MLRYSQGTALDGFSLTGMGYSGRWNSTDQVPARGVSAGIVDRFGAIDPTDGGRAQRASLSGRYATTGDRGTTRVSAYAIRSTLDLYNNFTYFLDEPGRWRPVRPARPTAAGCWARGRPHSVPGHLAGRGVVEALWGPDPA